MSTALLRPQPLALERTRPGVALLVVALHLGLLWVANLYWPLQAVVQSALHNAAQSMTVQILQKTADRVAAAVAADALPNSSPQAISNTRRQRIGRAEQMLDLPAPQTEVSTPLSSTVTATAQTVRASADKAAKLDKPAAAESPPPVVKADPVPERTVQAVPAAAPIRNVEEKLPELVTLPAPLAPTLPAPAPTPAPAPKPLTVTSPPALPSISPVANAPVTAAVTATASVSGSAPGSSVPGAGAALPGQVQPGFNPASNLNLNLPPRYIYRPPIAVPRRSLSDLANDQLRRKPRDPFAEGIEAAGNMDCLKDTPEGPAQGLLAIGPLLKRAIEEKCRK